MKKYLLFILPFSLFLISGCGTTLKQQWYNFNAYYNTFYNANHYFDRGLEENRSQRADINPNELIRIHPPPTNAGARHFEQAIEKSSDILRRHSQSKYVDDALKMIGVSFFYRQEYFSALEKFQELYAQSDNPSMRAQATIWEGRTYLELESYSEGIRFLESRLENPDGWTEQDIAEARAVLAQFYTYRGSLIPAGNQLLLALEDLEGDQLRSRAYFHYGQIMERMDNIPQAGYAFGEIQNMRPTFDLEYYAKLRSIDILRRSGDLEEAARELRVMSRNNKFYDFRLEVLYELAVTERMRGNIDEAEDLLNRVIHSQTSVPDQALVARSYYELAEIYRNEIPNYQVAAAYFDSAATVSPSRDRLPEWWNADELARTYGEFAEVKTELAHLDSMLMLARLSPEEFEEKIAEIEARQRAEVEQERREQERIGETAANMVLAEDVVTTTDTDISRHGFLNINNRTLLNQSSVQFRNVWGNRPLADDWRRRQAVSGSRDDFENQRVFVDTEDIEPEELTEEIPGLQLDLSEIPFETQQQEAMEDRRYRLFHQLGNVFLMNLNMPDSAKVYFERVAREGSENAPKASSMYALMDIHTDRGEEQNALYWAEKIIDQYPESSHAEVAASRTGLDLPVAADQLPDVEREIIQADPDRIDLQEVEEHVQRLIAMAERSDNRQQAARLLFGAAREYIVEARRDTVYDLKRNRWLLIEQQAEEYTELQALLQNESDSIQVERELLTQVGFEGELLTSEMLTELYPYKGPAWDNAREILREIIDNYRGTETAVRAEILFRELTKYNL